MKKKLFKRVSIILVLAFLFLIFVEASEVLAQTATASATASATPTATPDTLPDAGISTPTMFGMAIGLLAIFLSLALAL